MTNICFVSFIVPCAMACQRAKGQDNKGKTSSDLKDRFI